MTDTKTKSAMKDDIKLAKAKALLARAGVDVDKTLNELVAKYGANTYDIVLNAMLKPSQMMASAGQKYSSSKKVIEYYASHQVSADQLSSALGKTKTEVVKKSAQRGTSLPENKKTAAKAGVKHDKFNKRVSSRAPSKPASWDLNKQTVKKTQSTVPFKAEEFSLQTPWSKYGKAASAQKTPAKPKVAAKPKTPAKPAEIITNTPWNKTEKETTAPTWQKPAPVAVKPEDKALAAYNEKFGARISNKVSLDELMKQAGVTQADIQAVFNKNPKIIQEMGNSKTNKALARAASQVEGRCVGGCLSGVQMIHASVSKENADIISAQEGAWPKKIPQAGNSNSACNAYIPLEKSGKYITLTYPNKACNKAEGSKEALAMKEFNKSLPAGTTVCIDNKIPDGYRGKAGLSESEIHGHTWVLDNNKASCSDGRQENGPRFTRYGKNMHLSIATDNCVSKELAIELIKQKQIREQAQALAKQQAKGRA